MKRLAVVALLAFCFVAPLQAVMQSWTMDFHAQNTGYTEGEEVTFVLAIVRTYGASTDPEEHWATTNISKQEITTTVGKGGALDFKVTFDFPEDFDPSKGGGLFGEQRYMRFYIHDTKNSQSYWYSYGSGTWTPEALQEMLTGNHEATFAPPTGAFAVDGITFTGTRVTPAPEPTVLALLALGVAGVALRRKVA